MRIRMMTPFVVAVLGLLLVTPGKADLLYDNGPIETVPDYGLGSRISPSPFEATNSFTFTSAENITSIQVGLITGHGSMPVTLDWSIGTSPFGTEIAHGAAGLTTTLYQSIGHPLIDSWYSTFPVILTLAAGQYYLTLSDVGGGNTSWSQAWPRNSLTIAYYTNLDDDLVYRHYPTTYTDSFQIYGSTATVPEPSLMVLLGISMASIVGLRRWWKD